MTDDNKFHKKEELILSIVKRPNVIDYGTQATRLWVLSENNGAKTITLVQMYKDNGEFFQYSYKEFPVAGSEIYGCPARIIEKQTDNSPEMQKWIAANNEEYKLKRTRKVFFDRLRHGDHIRIKKDDPRIYKFLDHLNGDLRLSCLDHDGSYNRPFRIQRKSIDILQRIEVD